MENDNVGIYLAHPLHARHFVRKNYESVLDELDFVVINPFEDEMKEYADRDVLDIEESVRDDFHGIVTRDLIKLQAADMVFVVLNQGLRIGSTMEIVYAHLYHKPVVALVAKPDQYHPWLLEHCAVVTTKFNVAVAALVRIAQLVD